VIHGVLPELRKANIAHAVTLGLPRLHGRPFGSDSLSIVCFGPSLKDTWRHIRRPFMTVSGAHDFMLAHGFRPDYHVQCDPREHKAKFLTHPQRKTKYLLASTCHPKVFEALQDHDVTLWHLGEPETADWIREKAPGEEMIGGGTNVGLRAFEVAARLGYRRFKVYGLDCSFRFGEQWAGAHPGEAHSAIPVRCDGKTFLSSPVMVEAAGELLRMILKYDIQVTMHGAGLAQTLIAEAIKTQELA